MAKDNGLTAADAVRFFRDVVVRVATPTTARGEDGKERPAFKVKEVALNAAHIIGVKDLGDRVVIATVNGQKFEAPKKGEARE